MTFFLRKLLCQYRHKVSRLEKEHSELLATIEALQEGKCVLFYVFFFLPLLELFILTSAVIRQRKEFCSPSYEKYLLAELSLTRANLFLLPKMLQLPQRT